MVVVPNVKIGVRKDCYALVNVFLKEQERMISVEMTTDEAWSFRKFREFQPQFEILLESGLFEAKKSIVSISIDAGGHITDIDINKKAYKRKTKDLTKNKKSLS